MLCLDCPKRTNCFAACQDLTQELDRIDKNQLEPPKTPQQIENIELRDALRNFFPERPTLVLEERALAPSSEMPDVRRLRFAIDDLTQRQKKCLHLFYWENLSQQEIAKKLRISRQTVAQHLAAAIGSLRKRYGLNLRKLPASLHREVRGPDFFADHTE